MTHSEYRNLIELAWMGGGFVPSNVLAIELCEQLKRGEVVAFKEATARDIKFHRAYMGLLSFIYGYMPVQFQHAVPEQHFYKFLKHLKGNYDVLYKFKDGTKLVEYESISFGRMSQKRFEAYIREQLPWIYSEVLGAYFEGEMLNGIIATIEEEWENFLKNL